MIVSFLVLEVGFSFLKDSISKIRTPEELNFQTVSVVILLLSIGVKLWLGVFNRRLGRRIDSKVMMAVFTDSMGDVITTSATVLSLVFYGATGINIDGIVGAGVALVVMWAGVGIARDTLEPLIARPLIRRPAERLRILWRAIRVLKGHTILLYIITDQTGVWPLSMRRYQTTRILRKPTS